MQSPVLLSSVELARVRCLCGALLSQVDWTRTAPPTLNAYNLSVAGPGWNSGLLATLPATVGRCESGSPSEIYDAFLARRSAHYGAEAERLIDQMIADTNKGAFSIQHSSLESHKRRHQLSRARFRARARAPGEAKPIVSASSMKEAQIARNNSADAATTYCRHTHEKIAAAAANISLRSIRIIIIMTTRRRRKNNNTLVPATAAMIRREKHLQKRLPHTLPSASFVASGLMKRVFVHESKRVFIDNIRTDGDVELFVVTGNIEGSNAPSRPSLLRPTRAWASRLAKSRTSVVETKIEFVDFLTFAEIYVGGKKLSLSLWSVFRVCPLEQLPLETHQYLSAL